MENTQEVKCGDCLKLLNQLQPSSVDVVVTSPPYNIGIKYNNYNDTLSDLNYLEWIKEIGIAVKRVLKDNGSFFLNVGGTNINPWIPIDVASSLRDIFILQNRMIWVKSISIGEESYGHYKPINSERFVNNLYEDVFHFTKSGNVELDRLAIGVPYKDKSNAKRYNTIDKRCVGNTWYVPYKTVNSKSEKYNHPASYPIEFAEKCIKLHGIKDNMLVVDPFVGIGSSLIACKNLNVNGIGMDLDKDYCNIVKQRLK